MSEIKTELKTHKVDYQCDSCGVGVMQLNGNVAKLSMPAKWPHKCSSCGAEKEFNQIYPQHIAE